MNYLDFSGEFPVASSDAFVSKGSIEDGSDVPQNLLLKVHCSSFSSNISATEKAFFEMIESSEVLDVVLDLTNVVHINSRGLRLLVDFQVALQRRGRSLSIIGVSLLTERLFEYTRLDHFFKYERSSAREIYGN
jgi:anti-anti-sigma factor